MTAPADYKAATRAQWNKSGAGYDRWGHKIQDITADAFVRMVALASITAGSRVLELAAGAGAQTVLLAAHVGEEGSVLATDLAPDFLACAKTNIDAAGHRNVEFREMDGEEVDVEEGSFDAVVSSLGLMFFPNPLGSLVAQRRAAKPDGTVAALVISTPDKNPFFAVPARIIRQRAGLPLPAPGAPGPFALGAPGLLEDLFRRAELRDVVSESVPATLAMRSTDEHLEFLRDAFGALHMMMSKMSEPEKQDTWAAVGEALRVFETEDGFRCPAELIVCAGRR